jgi:hypothetical protein
LLLDEGLYPGLAHLVDIPRARSIGQPVQHVQRRLLPGQRRRLHGGQGQRQHGGQESE